MPDDIKVQTFPWACSCLYMNTRRFTCILDVKQSFCNQLPKGRFRVGTPNAFANIDSICRKFANLYVYSKKSFKQIKLPAKLLDYFSWSNKYTYIIYKYVHIHVYIDIYISTCTYMYVCVACVRVYVYIYTYLFIV